MLVVFVFSAAITICSPCRSPRPSLASDHSVMHTLVFMCHPFFAIFHFFATSPAPWLDAHAVFWLWPFLPLFTLSELIFTIYSHPIVSICIYKILNFSCSSRHTNTHGIPCSCLFDTFDRRTPASATITDQISKLTYPLHLPNHSLF